MNTWLTLDFVAQRYSLLPSQVLKSGSSLDIQIANLAVGYESYIHEKAKNSKDGTAKITPNLSQDQMQAMLNSVRKKDD